MKFFVAVVALSAIAAAHAATLTDEQKQKLASYHKDCVAQSGVDQALIDGAKKGEYPEDPKFKAHLFCVSQKIGLQNPTGEIQKDVIVTKLTSVLKDKDVVDKLYEKCGGAKGSGEDVAYQVLKCFHDSTPDHILLV